MDTVQCDPNDPLGPVKQKVAQTLLDSAMVPGQVLYGATSPVIDVLDEADTKARDIYDTLDNGISQDIAGPQKTYDDMIKRIRQYPINDLGMIAYEYERMIDDLQNLGEDMPSQTPNIKTIDIPPSVPIIPSQSPTKPDCPDVYVNVDCKPPDVNLTIDLPGGNVIKNQNISGTTNIAGQQQLGQANIAGQQQLGQANIAGQQQLGQANIAGQQQLGQANVHGQQQLTQSPTVANQSIESANTGDVVSTFPQITQQSVTPISATPGIAQNQPQSYPPSPYIDSNCNKDNPFAWITEQCGIEMRREWLSLWFPLHSVDGMIDNDIISIINQLG